MMHPSNNSIGLSSIGRREKSHGSDQRFNCICLALVVAFAGGIFVGWHSVYFSLWRITDVKDGKDAAWDAPLEASFTRVLSSGPGPFHELPPIPSGPPTETYLAHLKSDVEFQLLYDSQNAGSPTTGASMTEKLIQAQRMMEIQSTWTAKIKRFRRYLGEQKMNLIDVAHAEDRPGFLTSLDMSDVKAAALGGADSIGKGDCPCEVRTRPVLDMALVIPVEMGKYKMTWAVLESIRQLTVFPKEIVFVIGNTASASAVVLSTFVALIRDTYVPDFPALTHVKIFAAPQKAKPGDSRWFGFNQTTADIVTLFDNDDYMHPQFFHTFWRIFQKRPELDFALMLYEGANGGDRACSDDYYFPSVSEFLEKRQFREEEVATGESYPESKYAELWGLIPTFNKTWWLGNTDAEPNWENPNQQWWDMGCHNGWSTFRRYVMEMIPPATKKYGGEDAIWNYRVGRAKFNYRCIELVMGAFLKSHCTG